MLKSLLAVHDPLHPCADGVERYLTAEVLGDNAGLLRLALGKNKAGGGHPQPALFYPTIRVPLRATKVGCRGSIRSRFNPSVTIPLTA